MLDAADRAAFADAREELHELLSKEHLAHIPLLVLANKNDLHDACSVDEAVEALGLNDVRDRHLGVYSVSAKYKTGLDAALGWITVHGRPK